MNISLDTLASKKVLGLDNNLVPFYKSLSFWGLAAMTAATVAAAHKHFNAFQSAGNLYMFGLLLATLASAFACYVLFRMRLSRLVSMGPAQPLAPYLARLSSIVTALCGLVVFAVFIAFMQ